MESDNLTPWYAIEPDAEKQEFYNRPQTSVYIYKPPHKLGTDKVSSQNNYRPADLVLMELTVRIRKDLEKTMPFEWPDDSYCDLCVSWYEEQKKRGIIDIAYLCGKATTEVLDCYYPFCMVCWYSDGSVACFVPSQKDVNGVKTPVIDEITPANRHYHKPKFADNAETFKDALMAIAGYTEFEGWKNRFKQGYSIMEQENVFYSGQDDTFSIPQPYFKYLLAAQVTRLGSGMGSWYDLPTMGTESHKKYTNLFTSERDKALMYAINNC